MGPQEQPFTVTLLPGARRELAGLPKAAQRQVARLLDALAAEPRPRGSRLLVGQPGERIWRARAGVYRVLYEIRDADLVVLVLRIGHRSVAYRRR